MRTTTSNPTSQVTTTDDGHARDERVQVVRRFFQLLHDKDIDTWATLWQPQGKILVYYPAEGFPRLIEGKDQITAGFQDLIKTFRSFDTEQMQIFPAATSDAVCVQYRPRAVLGRRRHLYQRQRRDFPIPGRPHPRVPRLLRSPPVPARGRCVAGTQVVAPVASLESSFISPGARCLGSEVFRG
jgi:ketosteroid isomerase-like protein